MKIPICARLLACCDYVNQGDRIADVGCDHGYLSIYLLKSGRISHAIASDINEKPLQKAIRNAEKFGVKEQMDFYVCSGAARLPRDFDTLVCAGMGSETMVNILKEAPWLQNRQYRLILQCQSKLSILRRYLSETGWEITREQVLRDGRFLYTVMEVLWNPDAPKLTPGQWYISPALLQNPAEPLPAYFRWIRNGLAEIVHSRPDAGSSVLGAALRELDETGEKYHFNLTEEDHP